MFASELPLRFSLHADLESGPDEDGLTKRERFTEEQIIAVMKEHETGAKTADLANSTASRKRRVTTGKPSLATWKSLRPSG